MRNVVLRPVDAQLPWASPDEMVGARHRMIRLAAREVVHRHPAAAKRDQLLVGRDADPADVWPPAGETHASEPRHTLAERLLRGRWREVGAVHAEVFGDIRPAATMVEVSALIAATRAVTASGAVAPPETSTRTFEPDTLASVSNS